VASSKHRPAAFAATRACIDRIKENVPIWKREHGPHGATWVGWVDARCTPDGHGHGHAHGHAHGSEHAHGHAHTHADAHVHSPRAETPAAYPPDPSRHARPDTEAARKAIRVVTVTVSDTRTEDDDTSGNALREELSAFQCVRHVILRDDADVVGAFVREIARGDLADAVVLTGGTGIAPRDATYEAVSALFDKTLDGFGETFRRLSFPEVGPRAMLSRATAGTVGKSLVFALPGSTNAARLGARELVAPLLVHAVGLLRGEAATKGTSP
jgi:molybdenum cofactor biosynthesis protein B